MELSETSDANNVTSNGNQSTRSNVNEEEFNDSISENSQEENLFDDNLSFSSEQNKTINFAQKHAFSFDDRAKIESKKNKYKRQQLRFKLRH